MRRQILSVFLLPLSLPAFGDVIGFYSGDANGLIVKNEITPRTPEGMSTYQSFVVPKGGWKVTRLFTNNDLSFTPSSAHWEIRRGVSEGNGGTLLHSGVDNNPGFTATGRSGIFQEYSVTVAGLSIFLPQGSYWMSVTPVTTSRESHLSFHSGSDGRNAIGTPVLGEVYANSSAPFLNFNFTKISTIAGRSFPAFSAGVYIDPSATSAVPEPSERSLLVLTATGLVTLVRRNHKRGAN
ncbi:hypothetical protein F183_A02470 [Bryobacterales bacterium F-183]|nr:hypothetical protein F183_A02470 [Bryobacterales bacterium F-183]